MNNEKLPLDYIFHFSFLGEHHRSVGIDIECLEYARPIRRCDAGLHTLVSRHAVQSHKRYYLVASKQYSHMSG